jgi:hypothetical protein
MSGKSGYKQKICKATHRANPVLTLMIDEVKAVEYRNLRG